MGRHPGIPHISTRIRKRTPHPMFEQMRAHRIAQGLTQNMLASSTGYSRHVVERIETGIGLPSMLAFLNLCDRLNLDIKLVSRDARE